VIVDSVAALVPRAELEGKITDQHIGRQARMMSSFLREINPLVNRTDTILIFINQLREKIGTYGNPETTPGGRSLKFYSKIRIDLRAIDKIQGKNGVQTGNIIRAKVVKNKYAPPYRTAQFELVFGKGIDEVGEIADLAVLRSVIKKAGSWYSYDGETICQGREALKGWLEENPDIMLSIKEEVYNVEE
jgi:recombination protein RecA